MEDLKPEPVEKKSISAPSPGDQDIKKVPQEELENKANEDLAIVDQVPVKRVEEQIPCLDKMLASTIAPIAQTTGNEVDLDTFLNRETELRQRIVPTGIGKIKLTLKF